MWCATGCPLMRRNYFDYDNGCGSEPAKGLVKIHKTWLEAAAATDIAVLFRFTQSDSPMQWAVMGLVNNRKICDIHNWARYGTDGFLGSKNGPGVALKRNDCSTPRYMRSRSESIICPGTTALIPMGDWCVSVIHWLLADEIEVTGVGRKTKRSSAHMLTWRASKKEMLFL